jgi:hypothetical protein
MCLLVKSFLLGLKGVHLARMENGVVVVESRASGGTGWPVLVPVLDDHGDVRDDIQSISLRLLWCDDDDILCLTRGLFHWKIVMVKYSV